MYALIYDLVSYELRKVILIDNKIVVLVGRTTNMSYFNSLMTQLDNIKLFLIFSTQKHVKIP